MSKKTFILAFISTLALASLSCAATIPAGTTLAVRTTDTVSSQDRVGRTFGAKFDRDVAVKGSVLVKAGTEAAGKVEASRANPHASGPLTLNLTTISINGKKMAVQTKQGYQPQNKAKTARGSRRGVSVGSYTVPAGTKMEFQLAQPLNF